MHLFHIPQCSIQNRNVHISVLNGALWDMEQVHCHNAPFRTEMCTFLLCIVGYGTGAFWNLWIRSIQWSGIRLQQNMISIGFKLWAKKNVYEMPLTLKCLGHIFLKINFNVLISKSPTFMTPIWYGIYWVFWRMGVLASPTPDYTTRCLQLLMS